MTFRATPGSNIGPYEVVTELGRGAMAQVLLVREPKLDRPVALKLLSPELADDPDFRARFLREARIAAALDHPNVTPIYDTGEFEGLLYIAMRYVAGGDLRRLLDAGPMDPERALRLLAQVASALDAAHAVGLVHRDVKPANVLVAEPAEPSSPEHVYVADFGLAWQPVLAESRTQPGMFLGTVDYAAPEQLQGRPLDGRADVYALGAMSYECLVGAPPFRRGSLMATVAAHLSEPPPRPSETRPGIAPALDAVVAQALAKSREDRFRTCTEVIEAAREAVLGSPAASAFVLRQDRSREGLELRSAPASLMKGNIPQRLSSFVGREAEIAEIRALLQKSRLVTLTGAGGSGKTTVALEIASRAMDQRDESPFEAAFFVSLASITDPALIVPSIVSALGLREDAAGEPLDTLVAQLAKRRTLLVLDNFEQVIEGAPIVARLLEQVAGVTALVTSRAPLHLSAERDYAVPPLQLPSDDEPSDVNSLMGSEAVALFVDRAASADHTFALSSGNAVAVRQLCTQLDGLPLALELAAARVPLLTPEAMIPLLGSRLKLLTGGARDVPARQRTLQATIRWSYELLTPDQRDLFVQLAVFDGGATFEAAIVVCAIDRWMLLDGLAALVDISIVRRESGVSGERYSMLETIREFALQVADDRSGYELDQRHAQYFLALAESAQEGLRGPDQATWFERIQEEQDNFRHVFRWSLGLGEPETALRLGAALLVFWEARGQWSEGCEWIQNALSNEQADPGPARGRALFALAKLTSLRGEMKAAKSLLEESSRLARDHGDSATLCLSLSTLGWVLAGTGADLTQARSAADEGVAIARQLGDTWVLAETLNNQGISLAESKANEEARDAFTESLTLRRQEGDASGVADSLNNLGYLEILMEELEQADRFLQESLDLSEHASDLRHRALATGNIGIVRLLQEEFGEAEALFRETLNLIRQMSAWWAVDEPMMGLAAVAARNGRWTRASRLVGIAETVPEKGGFLPSVMAGRINDRFLPSARAALGPDAFAASCEDAARMSFEEAIDYALTDAQE